LFGYNELPARLKKIDRVQILKRKIDQINKQLTDWEDFVFADPQLNEANAHCTHLQIAQADPQSEICKRVQFLPPTLN